MKINQSFIKKAFGIALISLVFIGCQNMDRPELGDYPKDANAPGGPLKFYVAFDGATTNSLMNAVDSVRAKFPIDNPLTSIVGISGKALKGENYKYIKYANANDFVNTAGSFTIAFWEKKGDFKTEHIFSLPAINGYHWSGASMFLLMEGSVNDPIAKLFVKDSSGEKWFEWVPWASTGAVTGIYDGGWHHLAFVYDSTTSVMTLYVDGAIKTTSSWSGHGAISLEPSKITSLKIGAGPQEFSQDDINNKADDWLKNSWTGGLDQFRMYSTPLTASEVSVLYTKKK
ncbi:MAG TPA: hypothetical protein DCM02_10720 [Flavobacterium sp.]|nr:hypothetical protein [Flavobacterium sp.]HAT75965.1 hypothetical protein [Flavobacterium sp.]